MKNKEKVMEKAVEIGKLVVMEMIRDYLVNLEATNNGDTDFLNWGKLIIKDFKEFVKDW